MLGNRPNSFHTHVAFFTIIIMYGTYYTESQNLYGSYGVIQFVRIIWSDTICTDHIWSDTICTEHMEWCNLYGSYGVILFARITWHDTMIADYMACVWHNVYGSYVVTEWVCIVWRDVMSTADGCGLYGVIECVRIIPRVQKFRPWDAQTIRNTTTAEVTSRNNSNQGLFIDNRTRSIQILHTHVIKWLDPIPHKDAPKIIAVLSNGRSFNRLDVIHVHGNRVKTLVTSKLITAWFAVIDSY